MGADQLLEAEEHGASLIRQLPENHPYRIHGTQHVGVYDGSFRVIMVDQDCEFCRRTFKLDGDT